MTRRTLLAIAIVAVTLVVAGSLVGCKKDKSDKAQIEALFDEVEAALETGKMSAVAEALGDDYRDERGDKKSLRQYLFVLSRRGGLSILRNQQDIQVNGTSATATVRALVMQGEGAVVPDRADEVRLEVSLRKDDGWKIVQSKRVVD